MAPQSTTMPRPVEPALAATGENVQATHPGSERLAELRPQIDELARRVGGYRRLADLIAALDQSKEP